MKIKFSKPVSRGVTSFIAIVFLLSMCPGFSSLQARNILYVDQSAAGGDGSSWATAFKDVQAAFDVATRGDSIWIAEGIYKPTKDKGGNSSPADPRTKTFQLIKGVSLFGGFAGDETDFEDRDLQTYETIISGDLATEDDSTDNCYHVLFGADTLTLDGVTITRGYANGTGDHQTEGAGLYNGNIAGMIISKCTFRSNWATGHGGGMYNSNTSGSGGALTIDSCIFINNGANVRGGGLTNYNSSFPITVSNCLFISNRAKYQGGAVYNCFPVNVLITNCTFYKNIAEWSGGALNNNQNGTFKTTNSIFLDNYPNDIANGTVNNPHIETYNCISQPGITGTNGNIDVNPMLYVFGELNIRMNSGSPCIDAGDPAAPLDPDGSRADIGFRHELFSPAADAFISLLNAPVSPFVYGTKEVQVSLTSFGLDDLTSAGIDWEVDGNPQSPFAWTGSLSTKDTSAAFTIGNFNFTPGTHQVSVKFHKVVEGSSSLFVK